MGKYLRNLGNFFQIFQPKFALLIITNFKQKN